MKRLCATLLFLTLAASLTSCGSHESAYTMLSEFITLYSAEGVIYSPECPEGTEGYIDTTTVSRIFILHGVMPENYAIFLNSHVDYGAECGVFVCRDAAERDEVIEMCEERMRLLSGGDNSLLLRSGNVVFYSTLRQRERAETLWSKIIRSYT